MDAHTWHCRTCPFGTSHPAAAYGHVNAAPKRGWLGHDEAHVLDGPPIDVAHNSPTARSTLPRWYVVQGTRHGRQVPTFYLAADVQGITSADAAVRVARDILGVTDDPAVTLWAYAAEDIGR